VPAVRMSADLYGRMSKFTGRTKACQRSLCH